MIADLKKSIKQQQQEEDEKEDEDGDDDEIFISNSQPNEHKEEEKEERKKEEFSPEKLNRFCSELCCISDTKIIEIIFEILQKVKTDRYLRLDFDKVLNDFKRALPSDLDNQKHVDLAFSILFCAGFEKKRFGDFAKETRYFLQFEEAEEKSENEDEDGLWKI